MHKSGWLLVLVLCAVSGRAQITLPCTTLGQTPQTAFPICGMKPFVQTTVPYCGNHPIPVPGCGNDYADINPFWYSFTCYKSGNLGFIIVPEKANEDYDWQLFDVTGHDVAEVYTNVNLVVAGNWCGTLGNTGAAQSGTYSNACLSSAAEKINPFSTMPNVVEGHQYLLLVSHYTKEPNGYTLEFNAGTAIIADDSQPHLKRAAANCDGSSVVVALTKKIKCKSLTASGTDFKLNTNAAIVTAAEGINCDNSFDMDSLTVQFSNPLAPGTYTLYLQKGSDNTTLLDNCDNPIPIGDSVNFTVVIPQPIPFDSVMPAGCAPNVIQLVFQKKIRCNSIEAAGTDFTITGPTPVTITGAGGNCSKGLSNIVNIQLSAPLKLAGSYTVTLAPGRDGNTLIDECGQEVIPGQRGFGTADTVSAAFNATILYGCKTDTITTTHPGGNSINHWAWAFTGGYTAPTQNTSVVYNSYGPKTISLAVSNGTCADSAETTLNLDNYFKAAFNIASPYICPGDKAIFTDTSIGTITAWRWAFGNGATATQQNPQVTYPAVPRDQDYTVTLTVQNNHNCYDVAYKPVKVLYTCTIGVPTAFTPNGDGKNDYLYPLNAYKTTGLTFKVFNRYGQLIFSTADWTKKWDGTVNGRLQPAGTYVWLLSYTHTETHQAYFLRGTTVLIR